MGSLFKPPKYTPPPEVNRSNELLDEREERADAREKSEKRKIAARSRSRRVNSRMLFSDERNNPALGVTNSMTPTVANRNPYDTEKRYT